MRIRGRPGGRQDLRPSGRDESDFHEDIARGSTARCSALTARFPREGRPAAALFAVVVCPRSSLPQVVRQQGRLAEGESDQNADRGEPRNPQPDRALLLLMESAPETSLGIVTWHLPKSARSALREAAASY